MEQLGTRLEQALKIKPCELVNAGSVRGFLVPLRNADCNDSSGTDSAFITVVPRTNPSEFASLNQYALDGCKNASLDLDIGFSNRSEIDLQFISENIYRCNFDFKLNGTLSTRVYIFVTKDSKLILESQIIEIMIQAPKHQFGEFLNLLNQTLSIMDTFDHVS